MKIIKWIFFSLFFVLISCTQFSNSSQKLLSGFEVSSGMSTQEVDEESHSGQMRNIK
ncbi:MAG: hypothetical protein AB7V32_03740 [Candidatus Berkiella sp.]